MSAKRYHLQNGTVLDGRYLIGDVIGEGGFGITYKGENRRLGMRVAIKEFFCRDYLERDSASSSDVILADPEMEERFRKDKERFLKEARVLRDFSEEEGVVHVSDYFEVNGTAYIVMQYLEGVTLLDHVRKNGRMDHEELFRKMKPLLRVLGKIHETGLVHRDISPDNIMMLSDGTLCLIDFGAAWQYNKETKSYAVICKNGYASPEQYRTDGRMGPSGDIYSLGATVWYCLTGRDPEDSIQRVLFDELKTPGELGIGIPAKTDEMLGKMLELSAKERIQSTEELLGILDEVYPEKEDEKSRKKRRRLIAGLLSAAAAVLILAGVSYYRSHSVELRFRNIETETVWLTPDEEMTVEEYKNSGEIVRKRLEVFTGPDNYLWEENDGEIRLEFPEELLCGKDPAYLCRAYLTRTMNRYLILNVRETGEELKGLLDELSGKTADRTVTGSGPGEPKAGKIQDILEWLKAQEDNGEGNVLRVPLDETDLESVTVESGEIPNLDRAGYKLPEEGDYRYLRLVLTEEAAARVNDTLGGILNAGGIIFTFGFDVDQSLDMRYYTAVVTAGDGKTLLMSNYDQEGAFIDLLQYDLSSPSSDRGFYINAEWKVRWEEVSDSMIAGTFQRNIQEMGEETLLLRYTGSPDETDKRATWFHNVILLKERLDALKTPYAFGVLQYSGAGDQSNIVIAVQKDALWQIEAALLGRYCSVQLESPFQIEGVYGEILDNTFRIEGEGDGQEIIFPVESDYKKEELREMLDLCDQAGRKTIMLTIGSYPVAWPETDQLRGQLEKGEFRFAVRDLAGVGSGAEEREAYFDFLKAAVNESPSGGMDLQDMCLVREGEKPGKYPASMLPEYLYARQEEISEKWKDELQEYGEAEAECSGSDRFEVSLRCTGMDRAEMISRAAGFMEKLSADEAMQSGLISKVSLYCRDRGHKEGGLFIQLSRSYSRTGIELFAKVEHYEDEGAPDDLTYVCGLCKELNEAIGRGSLNSIRQENLDKILIYRYNKYGDLLEKTDAEGNPVPDQIPGKEST